MSEDFNSTWDCCVKLWHLINPIDSNPFLIKLQNGYCVGILSWPHQDNDIIYKVLNKSTALEAAKDFLEQLETWADNEHHLLMNRSRELMRQAEEVMRHAEEVKRKAETFTNKS